MNQPEQQPDDFDPDKTVPDANATQSADDSQGFDESLATIIGGPDTSSDGTEPPLDLGATMVVATDAGANDAADGDIEDALDTQVGPPDPALLATVLPPGAEDLDQTHLDSTQVWAPAPNAEFAKTVTDSEKFLMGDDEEGADATVPGAMSNSPASDSSPASRSGSERDSRGASGNQSNSGRKSASGSPSGAGKSGGGSSSGSRPSSSRMVGKSSWNLRIHSRAVAGEISGIVNPPPPANGELKGLATAMARNRDVPEYEVLGKLGNGAMGIVYRALQTSLNREMAIKTLKGDVPNPRLSQEMFVSEAVITANLVHPNIVPIHDLGRNAEGKLFYSMKQIHGREWRKVMKSMSLEENLDILLKVCDAVAYAHSRGVINRDLKPENVVIGGYGEVVVLDWGLAVTLPEFPQRESVLTDVKGGAGSPAYMAPELLDSDPSGICRQSDVYLLGGMLFEILEGFPPHLLRSIRSMTVPRQQMQAVITAVANNQIEEETKHRGELMQIARKAMATKPEDRYQTAEQFQDAIREYRITGRAEELLEKARTEKANDYDFYQQSVALFADALTKWPNNARATHGDLAAREAFAELARTKGDFDLGIEVLLNVTDPKLVKLKSNLKRQKTIRTVVRTTWMVLFAAVAIMLVVSLNLLVNNNILRENNTDLANKGLGLAKDLEKQEAELKLRNAEVEKQTIAAAEATKAADDARKAADDAKQDAEKATALANDATTMAAKARNEALLAQADATKSRMEAVDAKTTAEKAVATAKIQVAEAEKLADSAETKRRETENRSRFQTAVAEVETLVSRIESGYELRDYAVVLEQGLRAVDKIRELVNDPLFAEKKQFLLQQERSLQDMINRARKMQGTGQAAFPGNSAPVLSAISADGRTFAVVLNPEAEQGNRRIQFFQTTDNPQPLPEQPPAQLEFPVTETRNLILSQTGNAACLTGPSAPFVWVRRNPDGWKQLTLDITATAEGDPVRMIHAHFSQNEQRLYLIGDDRPATFQIYDLAEANPRPLLPAGTTLFLKENANYRCSHSALVPDESCLLVCSQTGRDHQVRAFELRWNDGRPQLAEQGPGRRVPFLSGLNAEVNGIPLPGDAAIRLLQVAPNGERLLVGFERPGENLMLLLDRRSIQPTLNADASDSSRNFPFYAPDSPEAADHCQLLTAATEKLPAAVRFSPDGKLLAALLRLKRSNLQFWQQQPDGKFINLPAGQTGSKALQAIDRGDGRAATLLPGHAAQPQDLAFFDAEGTRILVVDSRSVFHWNFATLNDYAQLLGLIREATTELLQQLKQQLQKPAAAAAANRQMIRQHWPPLDLGKAHPTALQSDQSQSSESQPTDAATRRVTRGTAIYSAEFSPDQRWILTGSDDLAAHLLDAGDPLQTLSVSDRPDVLRFTDTVTDAGTSIGSPAALAANGTGNVNYLLEGHSSSISSLRFLPPDGSLLVTSDNLGAISVWDAVDDDDGVGRERSRLLPFYSSSDITVSMDGQWILVGGAQRVTGDGDSPRGRLEYSGLLYRSTDMREQLAPQPVLQLSGGHPEAPITATAISADAKLAVTADRSGRVVLWSLADGRQMAFIDAAHEGDRISAATFLNPQQFLTAGYDGRVVRWSLSEDNRLEPRAIYRGQQILRMEVSPDLGKAALLEVEFVESEQARKSSEGTSFLVCRILSIAADATSDETAKTKEIVRQQLDANSIDVPQASGLTWTADGQHFLLMISDVLAIYRTGDWQRIRRLRSGFASAPADAAQTSRGLPLAGLACVSDPDGGLRLATSSGRRAQLWKLSAIDHGNGKFLASLSTHHSQQLTASFSADQKYVLTASDALRIFATDSSTNPGQTGRTVLRLDDRGSHRYPLADAGFSPIAGDLRFFSCDTSGNIQLWKWDGTRLPQASQITDATAPVEWPEWARQFNITSAPTKAAWSRNATLLAGLLRGRARCWKLADPGPQLIALPLPGNTDILFNDISFSGSDDMLAAAGLAWDRQTRRIHYTACVWRLAEDGTAVLAATLLDLDSEPDPAGSNQECGGLTAIYLDPAESIAITGAQDGRVRTWRLPNLRNGEVGEFLSSVDIEDRVGKGRSARTITHSSRITSIDLSPSRRLLTADNQGQLIVWSKDVYGQ